MKITNVQEVEAFLKTADDCHGEVFMTDDAGNKYNIKSALTQYLVIGLLTKPNNSLELWCNEKEDKYRFLSFFAGHPHMLLD